MTELNRALLASAMSDIRNIRRQVAETTEFRGYGPLTLSATAVSALLAGAAQARFLPEPAAHPAQYVALWLATGLLCAGMIVTQMLTRSNRLHSGMADEMVRMAVLQFLPAAFAGALLPFVLLHSAPGILWILPGLWQILFGLGVFASCRCLPRAMQLAGVWFLLTGFACLLLGDNRALAPAAMADTYAAGMAFVAAIHYFAGKVATHEANALDEPAEPEVDHEA